MTKLRFDDRVALITGAGAGLGRAHALLLGSLGAKVVVNDLGGAGNGEGKSSSSAADKVVDEIRAVGGEAVANYDSVVDGDKVVKTALEAFGRVDIVINNAGILRDVSFAKMSKSDWDLVLAVHLTGSMSVTHAAWPIMREQGFGRIVMTTSAAGIYGNFGQANYSAAKLGLAGLANTLAEEGRNKNIHVNTIAPIAASRLTETILPAEILKSLNPEAVSPLVAWLCHEDCEETKGLFEVGAGYIAKLRWERSSGHTFPLGRAFTVEDVAARWTKIADFAQAEHPRNITESMAPVLHNITNPSLGGNAFIDLDAATKGSLELESTYDENDLALYALGVGAARDALDKSELKFVYEMSSDFQALPTYGVMPNMSALLQAAKAGTLVLPGMSFGLEQLLHGEQYTELRGPLPRSAKLRHVFKFKEAFDKDPHAVVTFAISSLDEQGNEVAYNEMTSFVKGAGGWGGERGPSADINVPPTREPDAVIEEKTDPNQTLLYRLSGDWNPMHADPDFARAFGYDRPFLHGLCTYGYAGRHIIKAFGDNDGRLLKSIKVRFAKTVFPGDTLVTRMWKESDTRVVFETRVKERDEVVLKNAVAELFSAVPQPVSASAPAASMKPPPEQTAAADAPSEEVTAGDMFVAIAAEIAAKPELVDKVKTSFQFHFENPSGSFFIDMKSPPGGAAAGQLPGADVTVALDTSYLGTLFGGDMAAVQKLFFGGQLKITGNVMASNKLAVLQHMDKQRVEDARKARLAAPSAGTAKPAASSSRTAPREPQAARALAKLQERLAARPVDAGAGAVSGVLQLRVTDPESVWTVDLGATPPTVTAGEASDATATITVSDQHLAALMDGEVAMRTLHQSGALRVDGDITLARRIENPTQQEQAV